MTATAACPAPDALRRFSLGELSEEDIGALERHLAGCAPCRARLQSVGADPLVEAFRAAGATVPLAAEVEQVMRRLRELAPLAAIRATESGGASTPAGSAPTGSARRAPAESFPFLAPPQAAGELGRLASFRILRVLGEGGMGVVFAAEDVVLQRRAAIKVIKPELAANAKTRQRFLREARAAAALENERIVAIYQVGEDRGMPYLAMQLLQGESLEERLHRAGGAPLPLAEALHIAREIALGLAFAHDRGVIHRDLKPSNIWLESVARSQWSAANAELTAPTGATDCRRTTDLRVKILDFGLARAAAADDAQLSHEGAIIGTPAYMAPEQARGETAEPRSDLFSLGCVLYRFVTGQAPFHGKDSLSTLLAVLADQPAAPQTLNANLPGPLADLVTCLLAKESSDRPDSARDVAQTLATLEQECTAEMASADMASAALPHRGVPSPRPAQPASWRLGLVAGLLSVAVVLFGMVALSMFLHDGRNPSPAPAAWVAKAPLLLARAHHMAAVMDGRLYIVGGHKQYEFDGKQPHGQHDVWDSLEVYQPTAGVWRFLAPLPRADRGDTGRYGGALGVIDGRLHLAGGWRFRPDRLPTDTLLIYEPQRDEWRRGPPMKYISGNSVGGVIDRKFYVLSGSLGIDGPQRRFAVFDPDVQGWSDLPAPPTHHYDGAAAVLNGKLYVLGGGADKLIADMHVFDPARGTWETKPGPLMARIGLAAAALDGKIYAVGGCDLQNRALAAVDIYDADQDTWSPGAPLSSPRCYFTLSAIDNSLYAVGGRAAMTTLPTVEALPVWPQLDQAVGAAADLARFRIMLDAPLRRGIRELEQSLSPQGNWHPAGFGT